MNSVDTIAVRTESEYRFFSKVFLEAFREHGNWAIEVWSHQTPRNQERGPLVKEESVSHVERDERTFWKFSQSLDTSPLRKKSRGRLMVTKLHFKEYDKNHSLFRY